MKLKKAEKCALLLTGMLLVLTLGINLGRYERGPELYFAPDDGLTLSAREGLGRGEGLININTAGAEELESLPGIGPVLAQRVIDFRQHTPFERIEDIALVSGISAAVFEDIKTLICVE